MKLKSIIALLCSVILMALLGFYYVTHPPVPETADSPSEETPAAATVPLLPDYKLQLWELCTANASYPNEDGLRGDYIELRNTGSTAADLSGYLLHDGKPEHGFTFPKGTSLAAGDYIVVWCGEDAPKNSALFYADFGISTDETVMLCKPDGTEVDTLKLPAMGKSSSVSRNTDGTWTTSVMTPGYENKYSETASSYLASVSAVSLSEINHNNDSCLFDGAFHDYIELRNNSDSTVSLEGYRLTDGADKEGYTFPKGSKIEPEGYYLVTCGEDGSGAAAHFGLTYGETVLLITPEGVIADYKLLPEPPASAAIMLDENNEWIDAPYCTPGFENSEAGLEQWHNSSGFVPDAIYISELMPTNCSALPDESGSFPDWLELVNLGDTDVNLSGWYLSDNLKDTRKWSFPDVTITAGSYLIVYCGDDANGKVCTNFKLSSEGESLILTGPTGIVADTVTYSYTEKNHSQIRNFSDGSLEETPYFTPGFGNDSDGYTAYCASRSTPDGLAIWELMTVNDWYMLSGGKCYDWVELKNTSEEAINLSEYSLTDDPSNPALYTLPQKTLNAGESTVILLSGMTGKHGNYEHAPFTLSGMEDSLFLYKNGELHDYVFCYRIPNKTSLGRNNDQTGFFYMSPTPGKENAAGVFAVCERPTASLRSGVYENQTEPLFCTLTAESGSIYYTLDGSEPDTSDHLYTEPIEITKTTILRAIVIEEGKHPGKILTESYILNEGDSLPVVSLVTEPDNLWGKNGIYKSNEDAKAREVAGHIAYFDGENSFSLDCGINLHGVTTVRVNPKKSFTIKFRSNYDGHLSYDLFGQGMMEYSSLLLRGDMEGAYPTFIRDNLFGYLATNYSTSLMGMNYKYIVVYLNGEFWGIYGLREHTSAFYYAGKMGFDPDTCTMIKSYMSSGDSLNTIREWCLKHKGSGDAAYEYLSTRLDFESFADWIIFEAYCGNIDIYGNMRYYYSSEDGLWRCGIHDVDLGMFSSDTFSKPLNSLKHQTICKTLLQNEQFRIVLLERMRYWLTGPMSDENMIAKITSMHDELAAEFPKETERWGCPVRAWETRVNDLKSYCKGRAWRMVQDVQKIIKVSKEEKETYFGEITK